MILQDIAKHRSRTMEGLLDAADALAASSEEPSRPDFNIPDELYVESFFLIERRVIDPGQFGYFAKTDIAKGTRIMTEKPIAMVMDWQDDTIEVDVPEDQDDVMDDEDDDEEKEPRLNELLLLQILELLHKYPELWDKSLSTLFPRSNQDLASLPASVCANDEVFITVEEHLERLRKIPLLAPHVTEISRRLPLIIRYNVLSIETCGELLSYPGPVGHANLAGVGLFHRPSFFNHSSLPNCSRWAVGDVMCIVTNQDVACNTELTLSYIEHDILCESAYRRNQMLSMDFTDLRPGEQSTEPAHTEAEGPDMPVVDNGVQNELMGMDPFERLAAIDELMQQATGEKLPEQVLEEGNGMDGAGSAWFQADIQNLRILKAITLDGLGQSKEALALWTEAVAFCESKLPPFDESLVVAHVQAALCAAHLKDYNKAKLHALAALETHQVLFGGGVALFRRRFRNDLRLTLRPNAESLDADIDVLWPLSVDESA